MHSELLQLVTAFIGSAGFAMLWGVRKKHILYAAVGGLLGWGVYLAFSRLGFGAFIASFMTSAFLGVYAEILARLVKTPSTVFIIPAAVPLYPGSSLYYTVRAAVFGQWEEFAAFGLDTVYVALGIACGIGVISAVIATFAVVEKNKKIKNI